MGNIHIHHYHHAGTRRNAFTPKNNVNNQFGRTTAYSSAGRTITPTNEGSYNTYTVPWGTDLQSAYSLGQDASAQYAAVNAGTSTRQQSLQDVQYNAGVAFDDIGRFYT